MTPLHGHYTLQPRGVLTNDIGTAENFKLNKMVFFESHVREISTYLGGGERCPYFAHVTSEKYRSKNRTRTSSRSGKTIVPNSKTERNNA